MTRGKHSKKKDQTAINPDYIVAPAEPVEADVPAVIPAQDIATIDNTVERISTMVKDYMFKDKVVAEEVWPLLQEAVITHNFMELYKRQLTTSLLAYAPGAMRSLGEQATNGDKQAMTMLFNLIGLTPNGAVGGKGVMTQVNLNIDNGMRTNASLKELLAQDVIEEAEVLDATVESEEEDEQL